MSNLGNVRSLSRMTKGRWGKMKTSPGRILKQNLSNAGYYRVDLCRDGIAKHHSVHRLVASAFIDNPKNKYTVNHIDGDKTNNKVDNLEWATSKEQINHAKVKKMLNPVKGKNHPKRQQTHCIRGHKFTKSSTYMAHGKYRNCRECGRQRVNARRQELRTKLKEYYGIEKDPQ